MKANMAGYMGDGSRLLQPQILRYFLICSEGKVR